MNQASQPEELSQAYFYRLLQNPAAPPPPGLDAETAAFIRQLVAAEQQASRVGQAQLESAQARVWQRLAAQTQVQAGRETEAPVLSRSGQSGASRFSSARRRSQSGFGRSWLYRGVLAGMAVTIFGLVGFILLVIIGANWGEVQISPATNPLTSSSPASPPETKVMLRVLNQSFDQKGLSLTSERIKQRAGALDVKVNITSQPSGLISLEVAGAKDVKQLVRLVTTPGRVEIILVDNEKFSNGTPVQTSYCKGGTLAQSKPGQCLAEKSAQADAQGQPYQTIITNDQDNPAGKGTDGLTSLLKTLSDMRPKLIANFPGKQAAIVVDGRVMTTVQLNNLFSDKGEVSFSPANAATGQADLDYLTILLKFGVLPLDLEVVSTP